jgi:CBS domain-containing protein
MALVKDIMTTRLVVVGPDLSLRDLTDLLAAEHVSGAPVVSGTRTVGVVTLDDVISFQASQPVVPTEGSPDIVWEEEPEPGLVEGEESDSVFFLDSWADAGADLGERFAAIRGPEWDFLGEHTVAEAMNRRLRTVAPDETVEEAAKRMTAAGVHRLLVLDQGRLCGIITTSDITRAVGKGQITPERTVRPRPATERSKR